ncbi:hypothetical protein, partial [Arthrobacter sp. H41]|uniref:hypothetical protein n=1 Tax=Arthrobacter sp. H41 TaxID=1312978 RepID=UPI001C1E006E
PTRPPACSLAADGRDVMHKPMRIAALAVLLVALGLLAFAQWLPALAFLPVGTAMLLADGHHFSTAPPRKRRESEPPYE